MLRYPLQTRLACTVVLAIATALTNLSSADTSDVPLAMAVNDSALAWGPCPPVFPAGCDIAVLHGNPANPNADVFFRVPAKYAIPHHWHSSAERMVLISGELHVTYDGHDALVLRPGMYAYGPAAAPHRAECQDEGSCVLFIAFEGPVDVQTGDPPK